MGNVHSSLKVNVKTDLKGIKSDIQEYVRRVVKQTAVEVGNEIDEDMVWAMARYYSSYTPKYYKRHYYNFMNLSHKKYYQNHLNRYVYTAGTELTVDNMDEIYNEPVDVLWDYVYKIGSHGAARVITEPSPMDFMLLEVNRMVNDAQSYVDESLGKISGSGFSTLQFS